VAFIAIDCRMINSSGIGVYLRGCLPFFLQTGNNFFLIGNKSELKEYESYKNAKIVELKIKPFSLQELFFPPSSFLKIINKASFYYSPFFNVPSCIKIPVFTTIHDIIFPDMPELSSKAGLLARMFFYKRAYGKSKKIFTVSNFSKSRIEHHLGTGKPVIVTHSALQPMFLEFNKNNKTIPKKETVVFIGNIKKHKGLDCLLDAFELAKKEGLPHKLIIIGSKENFRSSDENIIKKIEKIGEDAVSFTGFVSDEELMQHLASAAILVQPSLYEGFCLPPLEAMVLGTHALISDIPVLKEVYEGFPVTFFNAGNAEDLKNKLIFLHDNKNLTQFTLAQELIFKYTFDKTVSVILRELYE